MAAAILSGDHPREPVEGVEQPHLGVVPAMSLDGELSVPSGGGDDMRELPVGAASALGQYRAPRLDAVGVHAVQRDRD